MQHPIKPPSENLYQVVPVSPEKDPNKVSSTAIPMPQPRLNPISETSSPFVVSERGTHLPYAGRMKAPNSIHHAIEDDFPNRNRNQSDRDNPSEQNNYGPKPPMSRPKPKLQLGNGIKKGFKRFISLPCTRSVSILLIFCSIPLTLAFAAMLVADFNAVLHLNPSSFRRQTEWQKLFTKVIDGLSYMTFNLDLHPILDLKVTGTTCPTGYDPINLGKWSGTTNVCSCPSYVARGSCYYDDDDPDYEGQVDSPDCKDIPGVGAVDLLKWDGTIFCSKRAELGRDYVRRASCPPGYRACSEGICLESSLPCPITSISITSASLGSSSIPLMTNTKFLTAYSTLGEAPLVNLKISLNSVPCYSNYAYTPAGGGDYEPLNQRPLGCQGYGADLLFSSSVDQMTETSVLTTNNAPSAVFDLPAYRPVLDSTLTVLAAQKRIRVATQDECLGSDFVMRTTAAFDAVKNKPISDQGYVYGTTIPLMILTSSLILFGFLPVIISCCCCSKADDCKSFRKSFVLCTLAVYYCVGLCELICVCVLYSLAVSNYDQHDPVEYLLNLHNIGCFQDNQPEVKIMTDFNNLIADYVIYTSNIQIDAAVLFAVNLFVYIQAIIVRPHSHSQLK